MRELLYQGAKTGQISFPLGGIGTGAIGLAGNGRLIDWEIYNRPNKGSVNGFSHFAVKVEQDGDVIDARVLNGDLTTPYQGELNGPTFNSFGWGPRREYMTGLPHFDNVDFRGEYPIAELTFNDDAFPGNVMLRAFNPLIPLNDRDSSIPAAFFEHHITNSTDQPLTYTLAGVLSNPLPANNVNQVSRESWGQILHLTSDGVAPDTVEYGDLTLATDAVLDPDTAASWQQYWFRGAWFDSLEVYWKDLNTPGGFVNRTYPMEEAGARNEGVLAVSFTLQPGETRVVRWVIAWNFPLCENYWSPHAVTADDGRKPTWKNYYATQWEDSTASAHYALENWDRLYAETALYRDALFRSTLPAAALDAVSANVSILKSPTALRLEDGTFYGWEGCHPTSGCCEGSCTHVWNYAQALPFLFPALERSMRDADYAYNLRPDGGMTFRIQLPLGAPRWNFRPCADGQFGGVLKVYRDWKISGDSDWLASLWPAVKQSIDFAWSPDNVDLWDPEKTGVLWGRQHHTLDMELFGPNSWLTSMYLGALKAGAEMAEYLGDDATAAEYREIFARGKSWADEHLFNGEYYIQQIDLGDKAIVERFSQDAQVLQGRSTMDAYWDAEHAEIKYQIAAGSSIDQVLGQWHADLYGLGDILDRAQVQQASAAIYRHNYIPLMRDVYNPCRIYCLNDEGGLVICAWPEGATKPTIPAPYSQETMNGFEYSAAIHMIMNGLVDEGMECVAAIRKRYDGERRNPWNEFECGSNYARSMASFALLNAFAGFDFDLVHGRIGFKPVAGNPAVGADKVFRVFWSLGTGWGEVAIAPESCVLEVHGGHLSLARLGLPLPEGADPTDAELAGNKVAVTREGDDVVFATPVEISAGQTLTVVW
ncbi:MAG: GH116 family glycosyl-hydrolase [Caldilineaceae bacterium]